MTIFLLFVLFSLAYIVIIMAMLLVILSPIKYRGVVIIGIIITLGAVGPAWASFGVNHLDIGGHYAGILMGLSNSVGSTPGFLLPIIVGYIVQDEHVSLPYLNCIYLRISLIKI